MISNFYTKKMSSVCEESLKLRPWTYYRDGGSLLSEEFVGQRKSIKVQNNRGQKPSLGFDVVAVRACRFRPVFHKCATSLLRLCEN